MSQVSIKIRNARKLIEDLESNSQRFYPHHNSVCDVKKTLERVFCQGCRDKHFTVFATHTDDSVFYLFEVAKGGFAYRGITNQLLR